jgi:hypothetical protein
LDKANPLAAKGATYSCSTSIQITKDVPVAFVHAGDPLAQIGSWGAGTAIHLHYEHLNSNGQLVDPYGWEGSGPDPLAGNTGEYLWEGCGRPTVRSVTYDLNKKLLLASGSGFLQRCGNQPTAPKLEIWRVFNLTDKAASGIFRQSIQPSSISDDTIVAPLDDPNLVQSNSVEVVKVALSGGPASRAIRASSGTVRDLIPPTVSNLNANPSSISLGGTVTVQFTISDSGGSGLDRAELWRAGDVNGHPVNWTFVRSNSYSGNGPVTVSFVDSPSAPGTYWYGAHVFDKAGNQKDEPAPVKVIVVARDSTPPTVGNLTINPTSIRLGSATTIQFMISDSGGSGLNRAELWRATDSNGQCVNWGQIRTNPYSGNGPLTATFTDGPATPGTYCYGTHVFDSAGNQRNEPTPARLIVAALDTIPPTVGNLSASSTSIRLGSGVTIQVTISDSGGSGLDRAELWRSSDNGGRPGNWTNVQTNRYSGNGPLTASFTDSPPSPGSFWYGTHVFDKTGNQRNEPSPIKITVTAQDTIPPMVGSLNASPGTIRVGTATTIQFTISDSGGSGLNRAELWRAPDISGRPGNWTNVQTNRYSGNGPFIAIFRDSPPTVGGYWYGTHVFDQAGNQRNEPGIIKVTVTK